MLELQASPLMWATILLLFLICLWWLVVEWGFTKPDSDNHLTKVKSQTTGIQTTRPPTSTPNTTDQVKQSKHSATDKSAFVVNPPESPPLFEQRRTASNQIASEFSADSNIQKSNTDKQLATESTDQSDRITRPTNPHTKTGSKKPARPHQQQKPNRFSTQPPKSDSEKSSQSKRTDIGTAPGATQAGAQKPQNKTGRSQPAKQNVNIADNSDYVTTAITNHSSVPRTPDKPAASPAATDKAAAVIKNNSSIPNNSNTKSNAAEPRLVAAKSDSGKSRAEVNSVKVKPGKTAADKPKYQTAAKARHPSSRSEASLQIPTPVSKSSQAINSSPQDRNPTAPIPFNKNRNLPDAKRRQSSIEVAVAQQLTETTKPVNDVDTASSNTDDKKTQPSAAKLTAASKTEAPVAAIPAADSDASLRAKLVTSERQIKSLQSALNNAQQNFPALQTLAAHPPQTSNRPTLMSKVRVLDSPKA